VAATLGVVLFGVLEGIAIAIALAVLMFFRRSWWPHGTVLGDTEGIEGWHSIDAFPHAATVPGVVVYRWEAPLFFANAGAFREQVRKIARTEHPAWLVVQCEAITDVDVTAAEMLVQLDTELNAAGTRVAFAEMRTRVQELVLRYGLLETLDRDHFYPTLDAALAAIAAGPRGPDGTGA
jgi:MFS superfamily sulfate permease-like transporter